MKLLIVDNEPNIVRGIRHLMETEAPWPLEALTATSAAEALEQLERHPIDVALLDIRMPGMSGLELQAVMRERWPACKVVFLSGYDDFSYIQKAMRGGSVDYVLKMDGDEAILEAVGKAIGELAESERMSRLLEQARAAMEQSLSALRRDYARQLLAGTAPVRQERFDELRLGLDASRPVLPLLARIDEWGAVRSDADKALLCYALDNIMQELLAGSRIVCFLEEDGLVGLAQPEPDAAPDGWAKRLHDQLEQVQEASRTYLKLPVSLVAAEKAVPWQGLPAKQAELRRILFYGYGQRKEMLLTDRVLLNHAPAGAGQPSEALVEAQNRLKQVLDADPALDMKLLDDFDRLPALSRQLGGRHPFLYEMYNGITYMLLSTANRSARGDESEPASWTARLSSLDAHPTWEHALDALRSALESLLESRRRESEAGTHQVIGRLTGFIESHLDEDLSLNRLADLVYLNPTYLSRLFKQQAGVGLSEHIASLRLARSCDLLKYSRMKIQDVAAKVGFDSATSFGRFFKREMNATPQEYRDREGGG
ncbi:Two-component response regulator yesN [Paenibacillus pasadenensis]|uniref:Two-component response regulator yesN n=1 Tax=Paenibacillus pasadenensis TaxID=217090 RepID=A0A2N5N1L3_9BACL|nr:response regulator [Paenibacillus pasadenensis]PLT44228.1 Two-component response regulator yesN [Paenibacillus pasadenensis]